MRIRSICWRLALTVLLIGLLLLFARTEMDFVYGAF